MRAPDEPRIDRLMTAPELSEKLGTISRDLLFQMAREGKIPHCRLGRSVRFSEEIVAAWLEAGGTNVNGDEA